MAGPGEIYGQLDEPGSGTDRKIGRAGHEKRKQGKFGAHKPVLTGSVHKSTLVEVKVAEGNALAPLAGSDGELEVVGPEHLIVQTSVDRLLDAVARAEQVLGDT